MQTCHGVLGKLGVGKGLCYWTQTSGRLAPKTGCQWQHSNLVTRNLPQFNKLQMLHNRMPLKLWRRETIVLDVSLGNVPR